MYRLLGELEIGPDDGLIDLPSGPTLVILAALLVHANQRISKTDLIRAAWGKDDVQEAQLHKRVMVVRDLLDQVGRRDDLKTHARFGYELQAAEEDVDALLFQRLVRQGRRAREEGTAEEAGFLWRALRLWRGAPPLSNVPSNAFHQEAAALERRHRLAAARLFELELARGQHELILDELSSIAGLYPSDRRLAEQFMLAAYRCGHLTDVTSGFERYRAAVAEETEGPPDALLQTFHFAVARGDEAATAKAASGMAKRAEAVARAVVVIPRQLPRAVAMVGRRALIAEVADLLVRPPGRGVPVVVVSGAGGIGKTALAVAAAHDVASRFPDGQLYAELRGTAGGQADTAEVLAQFLRALGIPLVPEAKQERLAMYRSLLAERRVLVVLDDAAAEDQVNDLVPAWPGCAVLVTARQRLPGTGTHHVPTLEPLSLEDSAELFRGVLSSAGIGPDDDPAALNRVVTLCGGLPLALRVAAALRVQSHPRPTTELASRLAEQGTEGFAYQELNVARSIGAGFSRLGAAARRLFLGFGLLPLTTYGLWTAAALLDVADVDAATVLSELAASFMVDSAPAGPRYRFHDLTRDYAYRRAVAEYPGRRDAVPRQVYRALLTLARRAHARLYGGDFEVVHSPEPDWDAPPDALAEVDAAPLDWFERERENIRLAVEHAAQLGLIDLCWDLAVSAHEFYTVRGYFDDWRITADVALQACREAGDLRGEGIMLTCLNQPALVASRRAGGLAGLAELRRAADLLAGCQDRHGQAIALRTLASALRRQGHLTRPLELLHEALDHYVASGDTVGWWQSLRLIGQGYLDLGRYGEARELLERAEALAGQLGDGRLLAQTRYWIGQVRLATGDLAGSRAAFGAVFDVYSEATGPGRAYALHGLGDVACREGAYDLAEQFLSEAADLARDGADAILEGRVQLSVAALRRAQGRSGEQAGALRGAVSTFAGCDAAHLEIRALAELAQVSAERGDAAAADTAWARVENLYQEAGISDEDRVHQRPGS